MTKHNPKRADEILATIADFTAEYGFPPTIRELALRVGLASTAAVQHHVDLLERAGRLTRSPGLSRTLRVADDRP
jgi:repressor LexA